MYLTAIPVAMRPGLRWGGLFAREALPLRHVGAAQERLTPDATNLILKLIWRRSNQGT
ncbi:MAG: hypothetical protein DHS20C08_18570 [Rhodomicrobium sp.]|nr:MAG: hypothetical protein DHS20C08_18570 [Rhodomicrobium sp.]